ncbi:unnamed protein product [Cyprideis torosa]|uniref:Uncharacterized protein n=1 Tax=Cyprideis torosa TaxID=163714 RepID=A0A7R8ZUM5_9CRUS|nr:unnamed protein product [Cyprideis torosa]CAG0909777.1 unnamed protein product [Cyprideis torosa]
MEKRTMRSLKPWLGLAGWLLLLFVVAALGAAASIEAASVYANLNKPDWAPPPSWFGPVWTVLYTLMAIAAWLVWREPASAARSRALTVFLVHLAVNVLWSWMFFGWMQGIGSLVTIGVLWLMIVALIGLFWPIKRLAALLLAPYLVWVSIASALNFAVWRMNPGVFG